MYWRKARWQAFKASSGFLKCAVSSASSHTCRGLGSVVKFIAYFPKETSRSLSPPQAVSITATVAINIHFTLSNRSLRCIFVFLSVSTTFDQLELVAVRVLDEGDHRAAMLHRPGLARHLAAALFDFVAGGADIVHAGGDMPKGDAELVLVHAPDVGELDRRLLALVAVAAGGERALAVGKFLALLLLFVV